MRVWTYPEKRMEELGARRWQVEWWTIRAGVSKTPNADDDFDWDRDLISNVAVYKTRDAAMAAAKRMAAASFFGAAQVEEQVVDWFVEEDRVAEWSGVGSVEEVEA